MTLEIWSIGKDSEGYIREGVNSYLKKVNPWCDVQLVILQLPKKLQTTDNQLSIVREEELILKNIKPADYLILLDERGKLYSSTDWASQFQQLMNSGIKRAVILIGGAFGVSENVKKRANAIWSLSKLVFPHQLVRLIVAEQTYRAFSILNNSPYHHI